MSAINFKYFNMHCYCQALLVEIEQDIGEWTCQSCLRNFDVDELYICVEENCTFLNMTNNTYRVCFDCAWALQPIPPDDHKSDDDATETSFLFKRLSSTLSRISSVTHITGPLLVT